MGLKIKHFDIIGFTDKSDLMQRGLSKKRGRLTPQSTLLTMRFNTVYLLLIIVELDLGCKMFHYADNTPHAIVTPTLVGC